MEHKDATRIFYSELWPHAAAILRMAMILTHRQSEAEDLVQEAMLKAFRSVGQFTSGTDAKGWLMTILRNAWRDRIRSAASRPELLPLDANGIEEEVAAHDDPETSWANPQDILEGFSDREIITALQTVPDEIRWTLLLVDVEGLDHARAAEILNVPEGTIKSRAHRGRHMLRATLRPAAKKMERGKKEDLIARDREVTR